MPLIHAALMPRPHAYFNELAASNDEADIYRWTRAAFSFIHI